MLSNELALTRELVADRPELPADRPEMLLPSWLPVNVSVTRDLVNTLAYSASRSVRLDVRRMLELRLGPMRGAPRPIA